MRAPTKAELLAEATDQLDDAVRSLMAARYRHRAAMAKWRRILRMRER